MASAVIGILRQDDVRKRIVDMGYEPIGNTPAEFAAVAAQEQTRWATIIQAANITSE
jgi:tripartite-type tricarboxylate transporter receptor subunit TctC